MAKFSGKIGFIETIEVEPGIWKPRTVERPYRGDLIRNYRTYQPTDSINDNINISNNISIIADPYANENSQYMKYVIFQGAKWKITNIDIQYPRMILTIGGVYNGE